MPLIHRGYSVHIESDGQELPHYQAEVVNDRTITCWIPSEVGKAFGVAFSVTGSHGHNHYTVDVRADGRDLYRVGGEDEVGDAGLVASRRISETEQERFVFSEVHFTSDDAAEDTVKTPVEDVAVIQVEIWAAEESVEKIPVKYIVEPLDDIRISERSKLLGVNQVTSGPAETYDPEDFGDECIGYEAIGHKPYAVFRFKHRPQAVLQAMGIIPRPAGQPSPRALSGPCSTLQTRKRPNNPAQTSQKRRRVKEEESNAQSIVDDELEAKCRKIKAKVAAERAEAAAHEAKALALEAELEEIMTTARAGRTRVKAERAPSPIRLLQSGEVVDLTND
ncbi:unnamed protein product [Peniophora sp. CBMAI 1063]|nr:unnamed protein product [Peniophora sp. CBMAI 1063]